MKIYKGIVELAYKDDQTIVFAIKYDKDSNINHKNIQITQNKSNTD